MRISGKLLAVTRGNLRVLRESKKSKELLIVHEIGPDKFSPTLVYSCGQVSKLACPCLTRSIPRCYRFPSEWTDGRAVDVKVEFGAGFLYHHPSRTMPEELMQDDPPVVCWVFAPLEALGFCRIYERARVGWIGLSIHSIRDDDILESALLADIVIIR